MPSVLPDAVVTIAATPVIINVLANDTGTGLTITSFSNPANGSLVFNGDKTFTYTPMAGFVGDDSFAYTVRDAQGTPANADVTISVVANTGATIATDDVVEVIAGTGVVIPVLANDMVAGSGMLQIIAVSTPGHGAINVLPDQTIRYVPQGGFTGIDSFNYTVVDEQGSSASATVTVKVLTENSPPIAGGDAFTIEAGQPTLLAVLANDSDPEGGALQIVGFTMPSQGSLVFNPDRTFTYTPAAGYLGNDQFTYTIRDNRGASAVANVIMTIVEVTETPVASDDQVSTEAGAPVTIDVLANDALPAGQEIGIVAVTLPYRGKLTFNPDKTITYTPNPGFVGIDDFTYTISNGKGGTAKARVTVEVTAATVATYANGYGYRRRIVVPASSAKGGSHTNFPLWVELDGSWLKSTVDGGKVASQDGNDLRFELTDGTKLAHELEHYDAGAGKLGAWVRLPELGAEQPTIALLYYGKAGLAASEAEPAAVWQDYLAVWHLPGTNDRSAQGRDLVAQGGVQTSATGLGAGSVSLNGDGVLKIDDASWLDGLEALSVQLKSKAASIGHDRGMLGAGQGLFTGNSNIFIRYQSIGFGSKSPQNIIHSKIKTTNGDLLLSTENNSQTTNWQAITLTWGTDLTHSLIYIDGKETTTTFKRQSTGGGSTSMAGPIYIGAGTQDSENGGWIGLIDEVRLKASKLASSWIEAEHVNQSDPQLFFGMGAEEAFSDAVEPLVAVPVEVETPAGEKVDIDVLTQALLPAGMNSATIQSVGPSAYGSVSVFGSKIRYAPAMGFSGADSFTYQLAGDGKVSTSKIRVKVQAKSTNDTPWAPLRTVSVATASQLSSALNDARPGDWIRVSGTISGNYVISANGTNLSPIVITSSGDNWEGNLTGALTVSGNHVALWKMRLRSVLITGADCRVSRNYFRGGGIEVTRGGMRPIIEYNEVRSYPGAAILLRNLTGPDHPTGAWIHHNYAVAGTAMNTNLCIGYSRGTEAGAFTDHAGLIEYNLAENHAAGFAFESKATGVVWQFNTSRNCDNGFESRIGDFNDWIGNSALSDVNRCSFQMHGKGHRVLGNYINRTTPDKNQSFTAMSGTIDADNYLNSSITPRWANAKDCLFVGNIGGLYIGGGSDSWNVPARGTILESHSGQITLASGRHVNTIDNRNATGRVEVPEYVILQPADVGPLAK